MLTPASMPSDAAMPVVRFQKMPSTSAGKKPAAASENAAGTDDRAADAVVDDDDPDTDGAAVEIAAARDHDPFGSGEENRADVRNVFDGDPGTSWRTQGYRGVPELGGLKPGVGLWLDVGEVEQIGEVEIAMAAGGASFTVYAGQEPPAPDADPNDWGDVVAEVSDANQTTRLTLDEPADGRVWLIWFTSLPPDGSDFRAEVSEVRLLRS